MKLAIAYDGTPGARAVFADLVRAGLPADTDAVVLTVATAGRVPSARALLLDEARLLAEAAAAHLRTAFPGWRVAADVVEGAPAGAIVGAAARHAADLVVTGTRGLDERARAELGSVAREVATSARMSVRVARGAADRGDAPIRLLLGYDASAGADDAVAEVCRRTWPKGTLVRLVTARPGDDDAAKTPASAASPADVEKALAAAVTRLERAGLRTSASRGTGDPRHVLLEAAASWKPDAIVLGGRRLQRLRRFLFGSVAGAVADDAACTVEVVRPSDA